MNTPHTHATLTGYYVDFNGNTCTVNESGAIDTVLRSLALYAAQASEYGLYVETLPC